MGSSGRTLVRLMALLVLGAAGVPGPALAQGADPALARLVEEAKREGEVHYIDAINHPKTHAALERAFKQRYGLPESFKFTHTLKATGQVVATVQQEIKARQHTIDVVWVGALGFFKDAARGGHFLPYTPTEWPRYTGAVKRLGLEADVPNWIVPSAYSFVPAWNRKCPGMADVQVRSWKDLANPAWRGKMVVGDVRKSATYAATWFGMEGTLGHEFFARFAEATRPAIILRTEESLQKLISCEYTIQLWQLAGRVYQRVRDDATLQLAVAWPEEGVVVLPVPLGILKGSKRPHAAQLFVEFLLSEEAMRIYLEGEGLFSLREGLAVPEAVRRFTPELASVKALPVPWARYTSPEAKRVEASFRRVLGVD